MYGGRSGIAGGWVRGRAGFRHGRPRGGGRLSQVPASFPSHERSCRCALLGGPAGAAAARWVKMEVHQRTGRLRACFLAGLGLLLIFGPTAHYDACHHHGQVRRRRSMAA